MNLVWRSRTIKGQKRYLFSGNGSSFFSLLSPKSGWRFWLEKKAFSISRVPQRQHKMLSFFAKELGMVPKDFLLYYTGDYKDTDWIGIIRREDDGLSFVKLYKEMGEAEKRYHQSLLAKQYFSPFFATASPLRHSNHILEIAVLQKASNLSIAKLWSRVSIQSVSLYENRDPIDSQWDISEESWIPSRWKRVPCVLAHGDLSHWNCFVDSNGVFCLIDYEEIGWYPPLYDCFHLLLKPTLLHTKANIPQKECEQLAQMLGVEIGQILLWLFCYLENENKKDLLRNVLLQNKHIRNTIENRKELQLQCKKSIMMLASK